MGRSLSLSMTIAASLMGALPLGAGAAQAAEPAAASPAPIVKLNINPGDKPAFANAGAYSAKHLATGFVCPASIAGLPLTTVSQDHGSDNDGSGTCNYGRPDDDAMVAIQLSPQGTMSKTETLAYSADMSGLPMDLPEATQILPLGAPGGPELGRSATVGDGTLGVWVAFKNKWFVALIVGFRGQHADLARTASAAVFKSFQDAAPATP